jgi:hypothetical protein
LTVWDKWCSGLTDDQVNVAAAGEDREMQALMATAPPPADGEGSLHGLLNDIFECPDLLPDSRRQP